MNKEAIAAVTFWLSVAIALLGAPAPADAQENWPPRMVCSEALEPRNQPGQVEPKWDRRPGYSVYLGEALRRGYTPDYCASVVRGGSEAPPTTQDAPPQSSQIAPVPRAPDPLVVSIQTLLGAIGLDPGPADGFSGTKTSGAIKTFQQSVGEKPDGQPSESLRGKLQKALAERGAVKSTNPTNRTSESATGGHKPVGYGTGFFVGSDLVITNNHVIEGCLEIRARKYGADVGVLHLVAASRGDDLAALRTEKASERYLKLRIGVPVKPAESVLVFGYPLTGALSSSGNTTLGNVTALTGLADDSRYIQISASVQPGNSGGAVLDDAGRLVGVIEGKLDALKIAKVTGDIPQNVNFAIRASTLATFLEANRIDYEVASSSATLQNTLLAEQAESASVQIECRK
jgi:S1-C subfamily serine protease